ncbi:MAG: hypothetical protein JWR07_4091 [Nevskia sp.]|nr:hypothetical protein [Nevskia sp.]
MVPKTWQFVLAFILMLLCVLVFPASNLLGLNPHDQQLLCALFLGCMFGFVVSNLANAVNHPSYVFGRSLSGRVVTGLNFAMLAVLAFLVALSRYHHWMSQTSELLVEVGGLLYVLGPEPVIAYLDRNVLGA